MSSYVTLWYLSCAAILVLSCNCQNTSLHLNEPSLSYGESGVGSSRILCPITALKIWSLSTLTLFFDDLLVCSRWNDSCLWCNLKAIPRGWKGQKKKGFLHPSPSWSSCSYSHFLYICRCLFKLNWITWMANNLYSALHCTLWPLRWAQLALAFGKNMNLELQW